MGRLTAKTLTCSRSWRLGSLGPASPCPHLVGREVPLSRPSHKVAVLMTSFNLNYLLKALSPHWGVPLGSGPHQMNLGEHSSTQFMLPPSPGGPLSAVSVQGAGLGVGGVPLSRTLGFSPCPSPPLSGQGLPHTWGRGRPLSPPRVLCQARLAQCQGWAFPASAVSSPGCPSLLLPEAADAQASGCGACLLTCICHVTVKFITGS